MEYVLSKDPTNFQEANNLAVALWRRKNPEDIPLKPKSIFAVEAELTPLGKITIKDKTPIKV